MTIAAIASMLIVLGGWLNADGQGCCGIGSALVGGSQTSINRGRFLFHTGGEYTASGKQYTGTVITPDPTNRDVRRLEFKTTVGYGITDRLSMDLMTSYLMRSRAFTIQTPNGPLRDNPVNWGLGDGVLTTKYRIVPSTALNKKEILGGISATFPWGPTEKQKNWVVYPRDLQTGSGTWGVGGFLSYHQAFPVQKIGVTSAISSTMRFPASDGYDYGEEAALVVRGSLGPLMNFRFHAGINTRYATSDVQEVVFMRNDGTEESRKQTITGTGGWWLDAVPAVEYQITPDWGVVGESELPVWRNVNGTQLTKAFLLRASMYLHL